MKTPRRRCCSGNALALCLWAAVQLVWQVERIKRKGTTIDTDWLEGFAKNFGLYGERVGTLSVLCKDKDEAARVLSQLKLIIRPMYSSPPIHGALIVKEVLSDAALSKQYYAECAAMAERITRYSAASSPHSGLA